MINRRPDSRCLRGRGRSQKIKTPKLAARLQEKHSYFINIRPAAIYLIHQHKHAGCADFITGANSSLALVLFSRRPRLMSTEPKSASSDSKPNGGGRKKHWHGTSRPYLISRLRAAGRVDLVAAVESGKVSAYACGVEMGWIKRRPVLGTGSLNAARQRRFQFDHLGFRGPDPGPESDGQAALSARDAALCQELWLGSAAGGSFFSTREELHDAWIRLRDVVMGEWARDGRRPMGWWQFEAPELG